MHRRTMASLAAVLAVALGAGVARAEGLDDRLAGLAAAKGRDFVAARERLADLTPEERTALAARAAALTATAEGWRAAAAVLVAQAAAEDPEAFTALHALRGLDPEHYLRRRRPEPHAFADLRRLAERRPAALLELVLAGTDAYVFAPAGRYPRGLSGDARAAYRVREREALELGLLAALGPSKLAVAPYALREALADRASSVKHRSAAAVALGETRAAGADATLAAVMEDEAEAAEVRCAAATGLGLARTDAAVTALVATLEGATVTEVRAAACGGLGAAGSRWAWESVAAAEGQDGLALSQRAAAALIAALAGPAGAEVEAAATDALSLVAVPATKAALESALAAKTLTPDARSRLAVALGRVDMALSRGR